MADNRVSTVAVIGAGIFGVSAAVHLARRNVKVILINDGPAANGASSRSLSWLNSARRRSEPYHRLRMAGIDRYRSLAARRPGIDWLRFDGGLTWDGSDDANPIAAMHHYEVSLGYDSVRLRREAVVEYVPGVDPAAINPQGAIFNPGEGWVDLPSLIDELLGEFVRRQGVLLTDAGAASVQTDNGRATGVRLANGETVSADKVLVATGASVPAMVGAVGHPIGDTSPISLLLWTKPLDHPLRAVLNTPRVGIRPAPGGAFALDADWASNEVGVEHDGGYSVGEETLRRLLKAATGVLDGNPDLELADYGVGRKPIPEDGDPVFGELPDLPGYYVAFSHSGATLGLIAGELIAYEMVTNERHPMLAPFRPERLRA